MTKRGVSIGIFLMLALTISAQRDAQHPDSLTAAQNVPKAVRLDSIRPHRKNDTNVSSVSDKNKRDTRRKVDSIMQENTSSAFFANANHFKPSPKKAVIYSAIFPGLGQIYNRKYWKLPILYGGFIGFTYAITWNNRYYKDYYGAYFDIMDKDDTTNRWHNFVPYGRDPNSVDKNWLSGRLKDKKDFYRYYRDLSIILTVAWYGLGIVDAYVDAQLFDFDISRDLSMQIKPVMIETNSNNYFAQSIGLQCSINF